MSITPLDLPEVTPERRDAIRRRAAHLRRRRRMAFTTPVVVLALVIGTILVLRSPTPATEQVTTSGGPTTPAQAGSWRQVDPGPLATRDEGAGVWTGREVIVVGGLLIDQYAAIPDGAAYNPSTGTWRSIPAVPGGARIVAGAWTGTEAVFVGNHDIEIPPNATASVFAAYDPTTNRWRTLPPPPQPVAAFPTVVNDDGRIVVWGSSTLGALPGAVYDPATNTWQMLPALPTDALGEAVTITGSDTITCLLAWAGGAGPPKLRVAFLDDKSRTWRLSSLSTDVATTPVTAMAWTGQQLIIPSDTSPQTVAFTYQPSTDRWGSVASPNAAVSEGTGYFTPLRLSDGRLVVRTADPNNPIMLWDTQDHAWIGSGAPPGQLPNPGTVTVAAGNDVFLFGVRLRTGHPRDGVNPDAPNAAWLWQPSAPITAVAAPTTTSVAARRGLSVTGLQVTPAPTRIVGGVEEIPAGPLAVSFIVENVGAEQENNIILTVDALTPGGPTLRDFLALGPGQRSAVTLEPLMTSTGEAATLTVTARPSSGAPSMTASESIAVRFR